MYTLVDAGAGTTADELRRVNLNGTGDAVLQTNFAATPGTVVVDLANNRLLVADVRTATATNPEYMKIVAVSLAPGNAVSTFFTPGLIGGANTSLRGMALDKANNFLYYTVQDAAAGTTADQLRRINLDGTGDVLIKDNFAASPGPLVVDLANNRLLVADVRTATATNPEYMKIVAVSLAPGNAVTTFLTPALIGGANTALNGLALDKVNNHLYYSITDAAATTTADQLRRINLNGTGDVLVKDNFAATPGTIALDLANNRLLVADVRTSTAAAPTNSKIVAVSLAAGNAVSTFLTPGLIGGNSTMLSGLAVFDQDLATVTTAVASSITTTGATLGGNVSSDGGVSVSERGVVYSTSNMVPTTANTKVIIGSGTGAFSQAVSGLSASTTYYVRAYAINAIGTAYGAVQTFTTPAAPTTVTAINRVGGSLTNAASVSFTVTFAASVTGLSASNFSLTTSGLSGASVSGVSGSGTTYTVTVNTGTGSGSLQLNLANSTGMSPSVSNVPFAGQSFTIDRVAPPAPVLLTPPNGSTLNNPTPSYTGTGEAGTTIIIIVDGSPIGTTPADAAGNWSFTQPSALTQGAHTARATATDAAGNISPSSNTNTFTVDTVPPAAPVVALPANGSLLNTVTPTYSGTAEAGSTVTVIVDGSPLGTTTASAGGAWSFAQPTALTQGAHTVRATATDAAGNVSPNSNTNTFTVDTTAPTVAVSSTASNPTNSSPIPVTVTFSEAVSGFVAGDVTVSNGTVSGFSGSGSVYTFNVTPTAGGTVTVNIAAGVAQDAAGNGNTAAPTFTITYNAPVTASTWTGAVSTDWFVAANWTDGVPGSTVDAVIGSGAPRYPVISAGTALADDLTLNGGATLTMTGGTLDVKNTWTNNGTFTAPGGTVAFTSAGGQTVGGSSATRFWNLRINSAGATLNGAASVQRLLTLNGNLDVNGQLLTLESTPTLSAMVFNNGGVLIGNATVQRAIDPSLNPGAGYRHLSSPVVSTTVADLATSGFTPVVNPAYNSAAAPANVTPFPTVFGYDEARLGTASNNLSAFDKGWFSPASLGSVLEQGRGYTVNLSASQTVDFVGALHNGTLAKTLSRDSGPLASEAGWHHVGNPYASPLDWTLVAPADRANLDASMYVFESTSQYGGMYRAYVNGIGGNPQIGVAQGFWVRVSSGQTSGTLTFRNSQRLTAFTNVPVRRGAADSRPLLQLQLRSSTGLTDAAYVYFEAGATAGADAAFDAVKLANPTGLNLAALAGNEALAIQGLPLPGSTEVVVPLQLRVPASGSYTLHAAELANLGSTPAYLRDRLTDALVDLSQQPNYSFTLNAASTTPRFELVFGPRQLLGTAAASLSAQVALYPNPARQAVTVELPASLSRSASTVELVDALGRVLRTQALTAGLGTQQLSLHEVAAGVYSVRIATAQGVVVKKLVVE
ncbi:hypothetical protein GCM10023185_31480 [Hymenobacter saemangeumensis]|uniref:Fibronectin type-III domain-containing protein n=1 Tax=Hymenobacter saemangeumensis TaxID=1084522 RepID=A0ABP8IM49_9BACT